jgi:hypothetical protein
MRKRGSPHVVGAAEMRSVKAVVAAASVEMTPTTVEMTPAMAAMAAASVTATAMTTTTTAPGQRGARQHGRQNNNGNSRDQF